MKKYFAILLFGMSLFISCNDSKNLTEPQIETKLVIDNGYYAKVDNTNSGENVYSVVVQYHVEGSDFIIGNYDIE